VNTLYSYASANYCSGNLIIQDRRACDGSGGTQGPLLGNVTITTCSGGTPYCSGAACVQCRNNTDCPSCQQCNAGACQNVANNQDPKNDCPGAFGICAGNNCNGAGACQFLTSTTSCRASAGVCDVQENCTGASYACGADTKMSASYQCRGQTGPCDNPSNCDGTNNACPPNNNRTGEKGNPSCGLCMGCFGTSATCQLIGSGNDNFNECNASWDTCDSSCTRSGPGPNCNGAGACGRQTGNIVAGNVCTGAGLFSAWTTSIYCSNVGASCSGRNWVDTFMSCTGSGTCSSSGTNVTLTANDTIHCGTCTVAGDCSSIPSADCSDTTHRRTYGQSCTGSPGSCSYPPTITACTGATPYCSSGTCVACLINSDCADDGNPCTTELCNAAHACTHPAGNAGTVCRASGGACDPLETCTGASTSCPADIISNGNLCGTCQYCNGVSKTCTNVANNADTYNSCTGNCDACDGSGNCKATAGSCTGNCIQCIGGGTTYNCAANAGSCTGNCAQCTGGGTTYNCAANAGSCTGTSASCGCQGGGSLFACSICSTPSFCSSGACVGCTQNSDCNDNNPCTVDTCSLGSCSNVPGNAGTICNAAIPGGCDVAETCTGLSATCPADVKSPLGTNCGGTCQSCDGNGFCINTTGVDYQNECTDQWTNCTSFCTKTGTTDLCNGAGACQIKNANIAAGNICTGSGVEAALGCTAGTYCSAAANNCTGNNVTRTDYACNGAGSCTVSQALSCVLQNCGGTCNNVTKACDTGCGDGILQAGEECDLASNNGQGFGCDNSCHNTNCTITSVTITPAAGCTGNVCTTANQLSVSVGYFGSNCNLATFLQTDFISTDSACKILQSSGTLTGMNTLFNTASNPFIFTYTIPNIPDVCAAKNMTNTSTGLYNSSNTFLRVNSKYNNVQAGIILDQCRYFGSLATYATYYTIIQNNTQCIAYTCSNYDAKNVTIINGPQFGVQLFNTTSGAYDTHLCNATVSDSVCPDDFSNSGNCKALGICSTHAINDTDCNQQTQMQCGITYTPGAVPSCLVPTPTPHLGCSNNINCVYANELTGANPQCFGNGATTINKDNNTIVCRGASNIWCPNQYIYQGGRCVYNGTDCSTTICPYAATVAVTSSNVLTYLNKPSPAFQTNYISNSNCWTTTNGKRTQYCGLILSWPENRFGWLPVQVFYASQGIRYPENVNPAGQ